MKGQTPEKFTWSEDDIIIEEPKKKKALKELFDKIKSFLQKDLDSKPEDNGTRS